MFLLYMLLHDHLISFFIFSVISEMGCKQLFHIIVWATEISSLPVSASVEQGMLSYRGHHSSLRVKSNAHFSSEFSQSPSTLSSPCSPFSLLSPLYHTSRTSGLHLAACLLPNGDPTFDASILGLVYGL